MSLFNFVNSIDLSLEKNVKSYNNSFIDKFMDELKRHLAIVDAINELKEVPKDTLFTLDRYEADFAVCENRTTGKMYDIPRLMIDPYASDGDILKLEGDIYRVNYEENQIQGEKIKKLVEEVTKSNKN